MARRRRLLDDEALLRTLGSRGGPYTDDTMAALVLHINREVMAHGADLTAVDPQWGMPPSGWAGFFGHADLAAELQ